MEKAGLSPEFIEELAVDLTVKDIMVDDVITLNPGHKIKNAKEIMRLRKISGIPIINDDQELVGIISIDDIVTALEEDKLDEKLIDLMSTDLITITPNVTITEALRKFKKHQYGRLPVIDSSNRLQGIITPGDITSKLLKEVKKRELVEQGENDDGIGEKIQVEMEIEGGDFQNSGEASTRIKSLLEQMNLSPIVIRKAAVITYEAEMNVVIHAERGQVMAEVTPEEIDVVVEDEGAGIEDIDLAMQPGYSTASDHIRELGFGAGMGLANIQRWSDELNIESEVGVGTKLEATIQLHKENI
ncbi:CBS domain-containing protein [Acetohalobium arabaticum]|uniref:Putative signal transduction protein with CBS domains n=1 Tax=Acetohalobium arabaticum (strain ATCC 49924 / DSM 5501 / Z-7288) TaxID=574087 RepID=D9QV15_ACEAZ|nr:CBS domain-containing protein [Acetohalobium arabaticum]ADL12074.1 putative signal transduction protein with CBS domains [Acetohalobium arabaticum DSM 5501]